MHISLFFFHDTATTQTYTLSLHDALPICTAEAGRWDFAPTWTAPIGARDQDHSLAQPPSLARQNSTTDSGSIHRLSRSLIPLCRTAPVGRIGHHAPSKDRLRLAAGSIPR